MKTTATQYHEINDLPETARQIQAQLKCSGTFARLLDRRGLTGAALRSFLHPSLDDLSNPFSLKDMDKSVERIIQAVRNKEAIAVYGDYDVDGVTASFVLAETFRRLKIPLAVHIPHRTRDGYGIQIHTLEEMKAQGIKVIISVDCGVRAFEPLQWAKDNGIDVIVTDHHQPDGEALPNAFAVINPHRSDCLAQMENLTGVGVAFKLAHALFSKSKQAPNLERHLRALLPFVSLGMIADVTELTGEARTLVKLGFDEIYRTENIGLRALCDLCLDGEKLSSSDVGFKLAPRINAAGRLNEADLVLDLLMSKTPKEARCIADELDAVNEKRKVIQEEVFNSALDQVRELIQANHDQMPGFLVLAGQDWHRGVVGIVAARIAETCQRPTLVFSIQDGLLYGSGRTSGNFPLLAALESAAPLFVTFGGHAKACGATLEAGNLELLRKEMELYASQFGEDDLISPPPQPDLKLEFGDLNLGLANELKLLEPYGRGNPEPLFASRFQLAESPRVLKNKHLKFELNAPLEDSPEKVTALWWNSAEHYEETEIFDAHFKLQTNTWRGTTKLQLIIENCF